MKHAVRRIALRAGLHVGRFPVRDSLQGHLKEFLCRTGVNCVLDVGAHEGEFASELREVGYRGRIVSFEPVKASFETIARKAQGDPNWHVRNLALGSADGEREINVYRGSVFSSFLTASARGRERFGSDLEREATEIVRVRRVDQVLPECVAGISGERVFLKMDTQGWDLEVMQGASDALSSIVGIMSELSVRQCYEGMVGLTEALAAYGAMGFEITGLFPVARDIDQLRIVELDCVLVRVPAR